MDRQEGFDQLQLRFTDPIQHDYEAIRPVVLFSQPISERSRETEMERTTVSEKVRRFITEGMLGLVDQRKQHSGRQGHEYPKPVANYILYLKQLYPPIAYREIVRIVERKYGYKTNHHTVKSFLERHPIPIQLELPIETFHEFEDAYQARWTVVRMYHEGWKKQSIANLLKLSRPHIDSLIEAFEKDGCAGLEDKRSRPALTACVTCWRAERGLGVGAGFRLGVENARKCRRIPPVRCMLCWAVAGCRPVID